MVGDNRGSAWKLAYLQISGGGSEIFGGYSVRLGFIAKIIEGLNAIGVSVKGLYVKLGFH